MRDYEFRGYAAVQAELNKVPKRRKPADLMLEVFGIIGVTLISLAGVLFYTSGLDTTATAAPSCYSDWALCKDNTDIAENYRGFMYAKFRCKAEADQRNKFGIPQWPFVVFSTYYSGKDYLFGTAILLEQGAMFSNKYGVMARATVICRYDLRDEKVVDLIVVEK